MPNPLEYTYDLNDPDLVSALDELPLWSAPFGLMMLDYIEMKQGMTVLDIGFGTGFPLIEMAHRMGNSCSLYGIDPWQAAIHRAQFKIEQQGLTNVRLCEGDAAAMNFKHGMFDLIVSNTGINNFEDPKKVLKECFRVMKEGGRISLTTNPIGHMEEFYKVYEDTLNELGLEHYLEDLRSHQQHRSGIGELVELLQNARFRLTATHQRKTVMRFLDGTTFFNHFLIRIGFLDGWKKILSPEHIPSVFTALEKRLNHMAHQEGELRITIPTVYIEAEKNV